MSSRTSVYEFTRDEVLVLKNLAARVQHSKQNVGQAMKDNADSAAKILEGRAETTPRARVLEPGERCIFCSSVGATKTKRVAKGKPSCAICSKPFHRGNPWRLLRGRRVHVSCL